MKYIKIYPLIDCIHFYFKAVNIHRLHSPFQVSIYEQLLMKHFNTIWQSTATDKIFKEIITLDTLYCPSYIMWPEEPKGNCPVDSPDFIKVKSKFIARDEWHHNKLESNSRLLLILNRLENIEATIKSIQGERTIQTLIYVLERPSMKESERLRKLLVKNLNQVTQVLFLPTRSVFLLERKGVSYPCKYLITSRFKPIFW